MTTKLARAFFLLAPAVLFGGNVPTTIQLSSAPNASIYVRPVALTAAVDPPSATGVVTFYDGTTILSTAPLHDGRATLITSGLPALTRSLTARYAGDATYAPSTAIPLLQQVNAVPGGNFLPQSNFPAGPNPLSMSVADLNGDGKLDVVVTNDDGTNAGPVSVLIGNGDGTFKAPVSYFVGGRALFVAALDVNADGKPDLVVVSGMVNGAGPSYVSVLTGAGNGTFSAPTKFSLTNPAYAAVIGDFNQDGAADIAIGEVNGSVAVLLGGGDGTFGTPIETPNAATDPAFVLAGQLAVADLNGDGKADLLVTDGNTNVVNILLGSGNGLFRPAVSYAAGPIPNGIAVGDFNGDGTLDLAVANSGDSLAHSVSVLLGNPGGTFRPAVSYTVDLFPDSIAAGDFNGDGKLDLATADVNGNDVSILFGDGTGAFHTAVNEPVDAVPTTIAIGDFNGDGRADLITNGNGDADISVLLNSPAAPDLRISITEGGDFQRGLVALQGGPFYTLTVTNAGAASTSGAVTVTDSLPAGFSATSMSGSGWTCSTATVSCTRTDPLAAQASYPDITLSVTVAASAAAGSTDSVAVTGGGQVNPVYNSNRDMANTLSVDDSTAAWANVPLPSGLTHPEASFLLTDGSVMVQQYCTGTWFKLTPDISGSYTTGTWTQAASLPAGFGPYAYASAVLPDGRLIVIGGEYNECASNNSALVDTNLGAIYDPKANTWSPVQGPTGWSKIGDAPSAVLSNGQLMLGLTGPFAPQKFALLNATNLTWTFLNGAGKADANEEEGWTLLPDGSLLTVDIAALPGTERYLPQSDTWVSAGKAPVQLAAIGEIGPQILRPDGTVFVAGASGHTGIFNTSTGKWTAGPDLPVTNGSPFRAQDDAAVVLPNGHALFTTGQRYYFDFDGTQFNLVPSSPAPHSESCFGLLPLPNGQILCSGGAVTVYTPSGSPNPAWAPTISTAPSTVQPGQTYQISGTQFNGLTQAVFYGDDYQAATNFPLVRIVNKASGHVFYARTHDHSTMAVATGSAPVSTMFDVPVSIEGGPSTIAVVANGISSQPVNITVTGPSLTLSPASLTFGSQQVGVASAAQKITLSSIGTATANITGFSFSGSNAGDFSQTNNCGSSLAAGSTCTVSVTFTPAAFGDRAATLTVGANTVISPTVSLTGTGTSGSLGPGISSLNPPSVYAAGPAFTLTVNGSNFVSGSTVEWNQTALTTTFVSGTQLTAAVSETLIAKFGNVNVTVVNPDGQISQPVVLPVVLAPAPTLTAITNNADGSINSASNPAALGSVISIYGANLGVGTTIAPGGALPTTLGQTSVFMNNIKSGLFFATGGVPNSVPSQINVQVPWEAPASGNSEQVYVANGPTDSNLATLYVSTYAPAIYSLSGTQNYAVAYFGSTSDPRFGQFAIPPGTISGLTSSPATAGDILTIYATGLGPVTPALPDDSGSNPASPSFTTTNPAVSIGGVQATVLGAAMTQFAGVYQINIQVPKGITPGKFVLLKVQIGGVTSSANAVIAIQ